MLKHTPKVQLMILVCTVFVAHTPRLLAQSSPPVKAYVATSALSVAVMPVFIAESRGYFAAEGLLSQTMLMGAALSVRALMGGSLQFITSMSSGVEAGIRGAPLKAVVVFGDRPLYEVVSHPSIRSFADLKGKIFGVDAFGSATDLIARTILTKNGLQPDRDVIILAVGTASVRAAALNAGSIHASMFTPPDNVSVIRTLRLVSLANSSDYVRSLNGGIVTGTNVTAGQPEMVSKFVRATLKGHLFYRAKREETVALMMERLRLKDREIAEKVYDFHRPTTTSDGTISGEVMRTVVEDRRKSAAIKDAVDPETIFDFTVVRRAMSELKAAAWSP